MTTASSPRTTGVSGPADPSAPLTLSLDVNVGDGVRFELNVVNAGSKKLELVFSDGRTHDLIVLDSLGREVWRWSDGRLFTQTVQNRVLRSNDELRYDGAWKYPEPGTYTVVATLASVNFPLEQRAEIVVR